MGLNEIIQGKHIDENCCTRVATQDGLPLCIRGKKRKPCQGEMREISGGKKKKKTGGKTVSESYKEECLKLCEIL